VLENIGKDVQPALPAIEKMLDKWQNKKKKAVPSWQAEHDVKIANRILSKWGKV
jgi:bifunctional pyridoxal-dependent enzyme with beta-cystathionase and maltose regulon repressor activities